MACADHFDVGTCINQDLSGFGELGLFGVGPGEQDRDLAAV
jgi:hypothetical protein